MNFCLCLQRGLECMFAFALAYCVNKYTLKKKNCSENCYILAFVTHHCLLEAWMQWHVICDDRLGSIKTT